MPSQPYSSSDGWRTCVGHTLTHRWQAVHALEKWACPEDPGGVTGPGVPTGLRTCRAVSLPSRIPPPVSNPAKGSDAAQRNFLRPPSGAGRARAALRTWSPSYFSPTVGQTSRQLKQLTHAWKSIVFALLSIHSALHTFSHSPQSLHVDSLMTIRNTDALETNPSNAPTGQRELQNSLPLARAKRTRAMRNVAGRTRCRSAEGGDGIADRAYTSRRARMDATTLLSVISAGRARPPNILPAILKGSKTFTRIMLPATAVRSVAVSTA